MVAKAKGIPTIVDFFGERLAKEAAAGGADLIVGNNVFAHVPDINDFSAGLRGRWRRGGGQPRIPASAAADRRGAVDTIYHEHFSYLSLAATIRIMERQGLKVFDVEQLPTHGGSLRIWAAHREDEARPATGAVAAVLAEEEAGGLTGRAVYEAFQPRIDKIRADFLAFLLEQRRAGKTARLWRGRQGQHPAHYAA